MARPSTGRVREPAVAGQFYPADPQACSTAAKRLLDAAASTNQATAGRLIGGLVPHAGWIASGAIAAQTIAAMAQSWADGPPDLVVVFGAVHTPLRLCGAALPSHDAWSQPGAVSEVDREMVQRLEGAGGLFGIDDRFHDQEHAVEVELPLVQQVWPAAQVLPVEVPLIESAARIGQETAQAAQARNRRAVFLASSDLTHYGPAYGFSPAGVGENGLEWALENDRRLLELILAQAIERIVPAVGEHHNACGGGAIAAMLAACREYGAGAATLLSHANSYQTLQGIIPQQPDNAVGYAAIVVPAAEG